LSRRRTASETSFFRGNVWRAQAEHLADSLTKGDRVKVTGRLRTRTWETPEGDKRSVTELEADEVGASLKWATAKIERSSQRGNGDRTRVGSGRSNAAATSTTLRPSDQPFDAVGALGFGRGRWLVVGRVPGMGGSIAPPTRHVARPAQSWLRPWLVS
jgi:single-strand DNA-binding protein